MTRAPRALCSAPHCIGLPCTIHFSIFQAPKQQGGCFTATTRHTGCSHSCSSLAVQDAELFHNGRARSDGPGAGCVLPQLDCGTAAQALETAGAVGCGTRGFTGALMTRGSRPSVRSWTRYERGGTAGAALDILNGGSKPRARSSHPRHGARSGAEVREERGPSLFSI